jgi:hypothetical protein
VRLNKERSESQPFRTKAGLGLLSTSFSVAQDAIGGFTSWSGSYGIN